MQELQSRKDSNNRRQQNWSRYVKEAERQLNNKENTEK